ncbi:MerR family transcriptional regulator [Pantoea rodasii]|uniref:MerR family transcriptional regulator n=1 Tax=Pantoea rodasii TaxID=1076549 RepID=A0A2M9WDG6_9GAMM|nr:MerR family transcriptional regulator [Pantoea rodasii]ORM61542.1 MerR family transcriptional regulator [Pantoea rodasii]PJZ05549.1 MerR family transcriptional regulator [Pantoea rodasii]
MPFHTTDTVCGIVGVLPETLRRWRRAGLIPSPSKEGYSDAQLACALRVLDLTAGGNTLFDIHATLRWPGLALRGGWTFREEDMLQLLHRHTDDDVRREMRMMATDYCTDDFVNCYLRPLNLWLRSDASEGATERQGRFHAAVLAQWSLMASASARRAAIPLFLEAVSVTDSTEIWMEAIRLTGQGFRVEVNDTCSGIPANALRRHDHHLMWCGNGISAAMRDHFRLSLERGKAIMLTGDDRRLASNADTLTAVA